MIFSKNFRFVKILSVTSLTKIRSVVSSSFFKRTSHSDDFILFTRVFRRAICFKAKRLIECQLISQNSEREICCARDSESSLLRIDRKISCWRWNRHELNCAEDDIVANWSILFLSTRWSFRNECEVYIVRHDEDQILCHESCLSQYVTKTRIFDLESKYVQENRMSEVDCERQVLNHVNSHMNSRW